MEEFFVKFSDRLSGVSHQSQNLHNVGVIDAGTLSCRIIQLIHGDGILVHQRLVRAHDRVRK